MKRYCVDCKELVDVKLDFRYVEQCAKCDSYNVRLTLRQRLALVGYFKGMKTPSVEIAVGYLRRGDVWFLEDPSMGGAALHRPQGNGFEYWDWNELDVKSILDNMDEEELSYSKDIRLPESLAWFMRDDGEIVEVGKERDELLRYRILPTGLSSEVTRENIQVNLSCLVDYLAMPEIGATL